MKDGLHVVATAEGYDVILWNLESATQRIRLKGHTDRPSRVLFSADGSVVVTAADDSRIIAWDVVSGKRLRTVRGSTSFGSLGIAISRDNSTLAVDVALVVDTLSFWSLRDNKPPRQFPGGNFTRMSFAEHDALLIAAGGDGEVQVFTDPLNRRAATEDSVLVHTLHGAQDVDALVVSARGSRVATMSAEGTVHVWDLADTTLMRRSAIPIDTIARMTGLTTDGRLAIVQHEFGGTISVWDITVSPPVQRFSYDRIARRRLTGSEFDIGASGRLLVERTHAGGNAPRYVIFGGNDSLPTSIPAPPRAEMSVDASTARVAYALAGTRAVVIANLETGELDTLDAGRDASGRRFADSTLGPPVMFSPRGDLLVTQASQFAVLVWDLATRRVRDSLSDFASYSVLRVSEDGSIVAAVDPLQVQFWRRGTHEATSRFRWKSGIPSTAFALSPDGGLFAADVAGTVTLIDVARGDILGEIETDQGAAVALTFVDGGRALLAVSPTGQIARIVTDPAAWADRACAIASSRNSLERWVVNAPAGSRGPRRCAAPKAGSVGRDTTP
jgi:WD40 repeat protein